MTSSSLNSGQQGVHWTVRMNRRNRSFFYALLFFTLAAHLRTLHAPTWAWVLLAVQFLVYPQFAYWRAKRSEHQRTAEMHNLLIDSVLGGLWSGALGLPLWITFAMFAGNCMNLIVFYGYSGVPRLAACMGGGIVLVLLTGQFELHTATDGLTTLACMLSLTLFLIAFAHDGYARAMAQHRSHEQLRQQFEEIRSLQTQLQDQAVRDPLTGLFNRRHLDAVLAPELARCRAARASLSLLMIDIDHFKHINDTRGHAAGDAMLQTLAQLLLRHVRPQDVACRHGGEEFLLMLTDTPLAVARGRAEAIRQAFAATQVRFGDRILSATLSCGVASFPQHGQEPLVLIECADHALYTAKLEGRNCVVAFQPAPQPRHRPPVSTF